MLGPGEWPLWNREEPSLEGDTYSNVIQMSVAIYFRDCGSSSAPFSLARDMRRLGGRGSPIMSSKTGGSVIPVLRHRAIRVQ